MQNSGKWVAIAMGLLGLVVAAAGWWFVYQRTRPVLDYYGPDAIAVMGDPDEFMALKLAPTDAASEITFGGQDYAIESSRDVLVGRGYTNARDALSKRETYVWASDPDGGCEPNWTHALGMRRGEQSIIVLLSLDCPRVALFGSDKTLILKQQIADGFRTILNSEMTSGDSTPTPSPREASEQRPGE